MNCDLCGEANIDLPMTITIAWNSDVTLPRHIGEHNVPNPVPSVEVKVCVYCTEAIRTRKPVQSTLIGLLKGLI